MMKLAELKARIDQVMIHQCPRDGELTLKQLLSEDKKKQQTLRPWAIVDTRETEHAYDLAYRIPAGYSVQDLEKQVDALLAASGMELEIQGRGGVVVLHFYKRDYPDLIEFYEDRFIADGKELSTQLTDLCTGREVLLGFDRTLQPITHHFRVPHALIASMSGFGKTDLLRWICYQLIRRYPPGTIEIRIIDLKGFSFLPFRGVPQVKIVRDLAGARAMLEDSYFEMQKRAKEVWKTGDRESATGFKWILNIIDEAAQISPHIVKNKAEKEIASECERYAASIACVGREAGVGVIYCTQHPTLEVISSQIKRNMEASIAFHVKDDIASQVIIDRPGAELLTRPGRAIYATTKDFTLQVPYIGKDDAWDALLKPYQLEEINHERQPNLKGNAPQQPTNRIPTLSTRNRPTTSAVFPKSIPRQTGLGIPKGAVHREIDRG